MQLSALRLLRRATDSEIGAASFIVCCHFECFWWFTLIYCCPGLCFTLRMAPRWFRITLQWLRGLDTYCFAKCIVLFQGKERRIGIPVRMQVFSWCCSCFEAGSDAKGSFFPLWSLFSFLDSFEGLRRFNERTMTKRCLNVVDCYRWYQEIFDISCQSLLYPWKKTCLGV